jgi:ribosomal protein S18 acetylase RimI-like enzyme
LLQPLDASDLKDLRTMSNSKKYKFKLIDDDESFEQAKNLIIEYADSLKIDLRFQDFKNELKEINIQYNKPYGALIIIIDNDSGEAVGCIGIRKFENKIAEFKRMYVKDSHRNKGVGKELIHQAIKLSIDLGYEIVRLDTLDTMKPAIALYKKYGFYEIEAYRYNPNKNVKYFELKL